jgi:putative ABC transport system permease protein
VIFDDVLRHGWRAVLAHRQRSLLTMLGILIGIASVILLTSVGEGTRRRIVSEFTQFGTNLVAVNPGRIETTGVPGALGGTVHPLTLEDAEALSRIPGVREVVPVNMGTAGVEWAGRERNVFVYGLSASGPEVWSMRIRTGRFLPAGDPRTGSPLTVLGPKLKQELFGEGNALGQHVRIAGQRFRVIGVMESKGQFLGFDIDDSAYIPIALSMPLFNRDDLQEIDVLVSNASVVDSVVAKMERVLVDRHGGEEDFTITTQTGMLDSLDRVLGIVSLAVAGIGAISLLVGAIGILTMMWISVNERTTEIGLAKALGATPREILMLYLSEAAMISTAGGVLGLATGMGIAQAIRLLFAGIPVHTPIEYVVLALVTSLAAGILSGILPARRAAAMNPVRALAEE